MSGLQSYYNAVSSYGGNLNTAQSYLDNYDANFYDDWKDKVADIKEQGRALMEAGGTVEGVYAGVKGIGAGVKAWRAKYGKKNDGDEDGDGEGDGESGEAGTSGVDPDDPASGSGAGDGAGGAAEEGAEDLGEDGGRTLARQFLGGGVEDSGTGGSVPLETFSGGQEGAAKPPQMAPDEEEFGDEELGEQPGAEGDIRAPAPEDPSPPSGPEPDLDVDVGQGPATQGGELAGAGEEAAVETGTDLAVTEGGADATAGILAAAGVAAEAVPVLGGLAAIGIGLYELFHHHDKPKPPPAPTNSVSQKGEMVVPSFDSVTDTPASNSAF